MPGPAVENYVFVVGVRVILVDFDLVVVGCLFDLVVVEDHILLAEIIEPRGGLGEKIFFFYRKSDSTSRKELPSS